MAYISVETLTRAGISPQWVTVTLDGEPVTTAVAADDENGWVEVVICDEGGRPVLFGGVGKERIKTKVLHGTVVIEVRRPKEKIDRLLG